MKHWILDENHNLQEADVLTWAKFFEDIDKRRVARTELEGAEVSTVFLGIDHGIGTGTPLLFETMVFSRNEALDQYTERYSSWAEAEEGHNRIVKMVKERVK